MAHFIASVLSLVFMYLAALHIYWLMGGKWLSDAYFPKLKTVDNGHVIWSERSVLLSEVEV